MRISDSDSAGSWIATVTTGSVPARGTQPSGTATTGTAARDATPLTTDRVTSRCSGPKRRCWRTAALPRSACSTSERTSHPSSMTSLITSTLAVRQLAGPGLGLAQQVASGSVVVAHQVLVGAAPGSITTCTRWSRRVVRRASSTAYCRPAS